MRRYGLWILLISAATITGFSLGPQGQQAAQQEPAKMPEAISFRILLGIGDKEPTVWDGKIQAASGRILAIRGWRFAENDAAQGAAWKISTRRGLPPVGAQNRGLPGAMLENGIIVTAVPDGPSAAFSVETPQGKFSFTPQEVSYGEPKSFLDGRVQVDRVPNSVQLTSSAEEQDFPAAAQTETDVYLAYVEFVHGDRSQTVQGQFPSEPKDFTFLARPAGGDQVMMMRYQKPDGRGIRPCRFRRRSRMSCARPSRSMAKNGSGSSGRQTRTATSTSTRELTPVVHGPPSCA